MDHLMSSSTTEHRVNAGQQSARCAVLTVSDTRTVETDTGGALIRRLLQEAGHVVALHTIVPDEPNRIEMQLSQWLTDPDLQLLVTTGGTGIARRDTTIEIIERVLDKPLPGFGELFRMLSWEQVGAAAMLSRAVAGLSGHAFIFALPGSTNAIELAMTRLVIPELPHLLWERQR
jgi:molybdopterin adenylyltransferase